MACDVEGGGTGITSARQLRSQLTALGIANSAIDAVWPTWWSEDAEASASARAELRFTVARRLGLDPASMLVDAGEPRFLWREEARFKNLTAADSRQQAGIASFGRAVASAILSGTADSGVSLSGRSAAVIRESVLASGRPFVGLNELVALSWGVGIPVVHLRVFPWTSKRMAAMTVRVRARDAVLLAKDAPYPAWIAFYLAHELGHIALQHVEEDRALVDLERNEDSDGSGDAEEHAADAWALELLTGEPAPNVVSDNATASASGLARVASLSAEELGIEPGTLALCFGYSTGQWGIANGALKRIYQPAPVWQAINRIANRQLNFEEASTETAEFVSRVLDLESVV